MAQNYKNIQDIMRERRMKDEKRNYYLSRVKQFLILVKRLALVVSLGYGVFWGSKPENQQTIKSFLKSHSTPVEKRVGNFKEGLGMIKEALSEKDNKQSESYYTQRKNRLKEYRDMGIDPIIKYAEPGTKEYREEQEFYRKEGVFKGRD